MSTQVEGGIKTAWAVRTGNSGVMTPGSPDAARPGGWWGKVKRPPHMGVFRHEGVSSLWYQWAPWGPEWHVGRKLPLVRCWVGESIMRVGDQRAVSPGASRLCHSCARDHAVWRIHRPGELASISCGLSPVSWLCGLRLSRQLEGPVCLHSCWWEGTSRVSLECVRLLDP